MEFRDGECENLLASYIRQEKLGSGAQASVYILQERRTGVKLAGKMFASRDQADREAYILRKLGECPGVVRFKDFVQEKEGGGRCYGTIVMELCGENLHKELKNLGLWQMTEKMAAATIKTLAQALARIHKLGVVHRDLKLENVLVKLDGMSVSDVVIGDFGIATDDRDEMRQYCGTQMFMAPEVAEARTYTRAVDIWGLGLIAYELLRGSRSREELDELRSGAALPSGLSSDDAQDLIQKMLAVNPEERITAENVVRHPWIVKHCGAGRTRRSRCGYKRLPPSPSVNLVVKKARVA